MNIFLFCLLPQGTSEHHRTII